MLTRKEIENSKWKGKALFTKGLSLSSEGQWHYFLAQNLNKTIRPLTSMTWRTGFRKRRYWLPRKTSIPINSCLQSIFPSIFWTLPLSFPLCPSFSLFSWHPCSPLSLWLPGISISPYLVTWIIKPGRVAPTWVGAVTFRRGALWLWEGSSMKVPCGIFPHFPYSHTWLPGQMPTGCVSGSRS